MNDGPNPKKRKRKQSEDPAWTRRSEANKGKRRKKNNESNSRIESLLCLMGVVREAEKIAVVHTLKSPPSFRSSSSQNIMPNECEFSTPPKGLLTSRLTTPQGTVLMPTSVIECDDGQVRLFTSGKQERDPLVLPKPNNWVKKHSPVPKDSLEGIFDKEINRKLMMEAIKKENRSQEGEMLISARDALIKSGICIGDREAHWMHFIAYRFIGEKSQKPFNLGIGLKYANGAMEIINDEIEKILFHPDGPDSLYLTVIPVWAPGFEEIRLLQSITIEVRDQPGEQAKRLFRKEYDALCFEEVPKPEIQCIKNLMRKKFLKPPVARSLTFSSLQECQNEKENQDNEEKFKFAV